MKKYRLSRLPIVRNRENSDNWWDLKVIKMAYDDLEFSQQSSIFFTSWEGTHLKELKCLSINHIYNTLRDKKSFNLD